MKEIALITLHGMGEVKDGYYLDLEEGLKKRLGNEWTKVSFHDVQYAPICKHPKTNYGRRFCPLQKTILMQQN